LRSASAPIGESAASAPSARRCEVIAQGADPCYKTAGGALGGMQVPARRVFFTHD